MSPEIVYVDFCRTLTNFHTLGRFVRFTLKQHRPTRAVFHDLSKIFRRLTGLQPDLAGAVVPLAGLSEEEIFASAEDFLKQQITPNLNSNVLERVEQYRKEGAKVVIVSAAIREYLVPFSNLMGFEPPIANRLDFQDGICTGKLANSPIIYGPTKAVEIRRYENEAALEANISRVCISDHSSDIPMLLLAEQALVVNPDKELSRFSRTAGWETLDAN